MLVATFASGTPFFGGAHGAVAGPLGAPTVERRLGAERGGSFPGLRSSTHRRPMTQARSGDQVRVPLLCARRRHDQGNDARHAHETERRATILTACATFGNEKVRVSGPQAEYGNHASPNISDSLAKAKLMTTPSNIANTPATVVTALCWERRLMRCSRRAIGISEAV